MSSKTPEKRLEDILGQIDWIESYVEGMSYDTFLDDR